MEGDVVTICFMWCQLLITQSAPPLIPQTSQWFFSTYREGALPAFLQGVSHIKATILEKTKLDAIETAPDIFSLSFSPSLRQSEGVYIFLTVLFQAVC